MLTEELQTYLNSLPNDVTFIDLSKKNLYMLPDLSRFINLQYLECSDNCLTSLPKLNQTLLELHCDKNKLTWLPDLNYSLRILYCAYNNLTCLPELNENIVEVYCQNNKLTCLPLVKPDFHINLLTLMYDNNPVFYDLIEKKRVDALLETIHQVYLDTYDDKYGPF